MKNIISAVLAWILWIQTGALQHPEKHSSIAPYKTEEKCATEIAHLADTARDTKGYKKIAFDKVSLRLERFDGYLIVFSCLPDTLGPKAP